MFESLTTRTAIKKDFSDKDRKALAKDGKAMPDGSYPIESVQDLKNAVQAYGRASDPEAVKKHIKSRAKALNAESELPEDWKAAKAEAPTLSAILKGDKAVASGTPSDTDGDAGADYSKAADAARAASDGANDASSKAFGNSWDTSAHSFASKAHGLAADAHKAAAKAANANNDSKMAEHHKGRRALHQATADLHSQHYGGSN